MSSSWDDDDSSSENDNDFEDEFDDGVLFNSSNSYFSEDVMIDIQTNSESVKKTLHDDCIDQAVVAATTLQRVCGDSDAWISDQTQTIISNLSVVLMEVRTNPGRFAISSILTQDKSHEDKVDKLNNLIFQAREAIAEMEQQHLSIVE